MIFCTSWVSVPAAKGGLPAAHSYMMHPSAHRSLAVLCGPFWNNSGAMYAGDALFACMHTGVALKPPRPAPNNMCGQTLCYQRLCRGAVIHSTSGWSGLWQAI